LDITVCPQGAHASRKSDLKNLSGEITWPSSILKNIGA
jgi:hypothetical protein